VGHIYCKVNFILIILLTPIKPFGLTSVLITNKLMKKLITLLSLSFTIALSAQDLYDKSNVTTIDLTFEDLNWKQTMDTYYSNDIGERLIGSAVVNGVVFDSVGVKFKGNSTYSSNNGKNPLNVKLDHTNKLDYDGFTTLKLSTGDKDPSFVREVLSYEIGRYYMDMPLSNYAYITINGSDYGLYSSSESINGDYQNKYLNASNKNTRFKCNPIAGAGPGATDLPTLEYLGTDSSDYFASYELKSDFGWNDLVDFTNSLENNTVNLETFLDIDRAIWMLAFDNVFMNMDSYIGAFQQNYYLIEDNNGRMLPIIWDLNESIGGFPVSMGGGGPGGPGGSSIESFTEMELFINEGSATFPLVNAIFNNDRYKRMYVAHAKTIVQEFIDNDWYVEEAQVLQDVISTEVQSDPNANYTFAEFSGNLASTQSGEFSINDLLGGRGVYLNSTTEFSYTQPTIDNINNSPTLVSANSTVVITADILDADYVFLAYRNNASELFTKIEMLDDGSNGDGSANDNIFGVSIPTITTDIEYYIYADNSNAGVFSPQRAAHEYHSLGLSADVVVNEIMASNSSTIVDQDGEYDDWIEVYNNTLSEFSLNGYYLSDDGLELNKWAFPDTSIAAEGYLIVWADKDSLQAGLHTNFKLSSSGESLYFVNNGVSIIDQVDFFNQTTDISYGRFSNGRGAFASMPATFGVENSLTSPTVNVIEINEKVGFIVYPNPSSNMINIVGDFIDVNLVVITDLQGREVLNRQLSSNSIIDVSQWTNGIYLVRIGNQVEKIVKY
jgi:spore coat protein CotH